MPAQLILLSGLPGRMAAEVALAAQATGGDAAIATHHVALSHATTAAPHVEGAQAFDLVGPDDRASLEFPAGIVAVDFTQPDVALDNLDYYLARRIPVVMGTTGFDRNEAVRRVQAAGVPAVIAPNMAIPIVLIQSAMRSLAERYPGALAGYGFRVMESHQQGKKDTSGTAKALVAEFARLGLPATVDGIQQIRVPEQQRRELNVPEAHLGGHAYHFYHVNSPDDSVRVGLSHCVHGRRVYAEGALVAVRFLAARAAQGVGGVCYSMEDVLGDA